MLMKMLTTMWQHRKLYKHNYHSWVDRMSGGFLGQCVEICSLDSLNQEGSGLGDRPLGPCEAPTPIPEGMVSFRTGAAAEDVM